jgi:hypothetical protein
LALFKEVRKWSVVTWTWSWGGVAIASGKRGGGYKTAEKYSPSIEMGSEKRSSRESRPRSGALACLYNPVRNHVVVVLVVRGKPRPMNTEETIGSKTRAQICSFGSSQQLECHKVWSKCIFSESIQVGDPNSSFLSIWVDLLTECVSQSDLHLQRCPFIRCQF